MSEVQETGIRQKTQHIEKPQTSSSKTRKVYVLGVAFVAVLLLGTSLGMILSATTPSIPTVIEPGSMNSAYSFVVFTDGPNYFAKNGTTGAISYSSTNARTVIQAAINAIPTQAGNLLVKKGIYSLKGAGDRLSCLSINERSNISIIGESGAVFQLDATSYEYTNLLDIIGSDHIIIERFVFDWNDVALMDPLQGYWGCSVHIIGSDGLAGRPRSSVDITVRNCEFIDGGFAVVYGCGNISDIEVSASYFLNAGSIPIAFEWGLKDGEDVFVDITSKPNGIVMKNNWVIGGTFSSIYLTGVDNVLMDGNMIVADCSENVIQFYEGDAGLGGIGIKFINNYVIGTSTSENIINVAGEFVGVLIQGNSFNVTPYKHLLGITGSAGGNKYAHDVVFSDNSVIMRTGQNLVWIGYAYDVRIINNWVSRGNDTPNTYVTLNLDLCYNIVIQRNQFHVKSGNNILDIDTVVHDIVFAENMISMTNGTNVVMNKGFDVWILDNKFNATTEIDIFLYSSCGKTIIAGNIFANTGALCIWAQGGDYSIIEGNIFYGWSVTVALEMAIYLHGCKRIVISGNNFGAGGYAGFYNCIFEDSTSDYNTIIGNVVKNGTAAAIELSGVHSINEHNILIY